MACTPLKIASPLSLRLQARHDWKKRRRKANIWGTDSPRGRHVTIRITYRYGKNLRSFWQHFPRCRSQSSSLFQILRKKLQNKAGQITKILAQDSWVFFIFNTCIFFFLPGPSKRRTFRKSLRINGHRWIQIDIRKWENIWIGPTPNIRGHRPPTTSGKWIQMT
jgi:hypothetical protein